MSTTNSAIAGPVLIVEDDRRTAELLKLNLTNAGFDTKIVSTGADALGFVSKRPPVLVILDVMLPDMEGWEVCRRVRKLSAAPVVMLSGMGAVPDRIRGLTLGADDYIVKPCSFEEVVARVRTVLRRARASALEETLQRGALAIDVSRRRVTYAGEQLGLTRSEFRLLHALAGEPGRVFSRQELIACLYGSAGSVVDRVIDVHLANLRQKLQALQGRPVMIRTVRGYGYYFDEAAELAALPGAA